MCLVRPESFEQVVLIIVVVLVESIDPARQGGDDFGGVSAAQFDSMR